MGGALELLLLLLVCFVVDGGLALFIRLLVYMFLPVCVFVYLLICLLVCKFVGVSFR